MKTLSFLLIVLFLLTFDTLAQSNYYERDREIESRVDRLLQTRDVGELANELAAKKSATTEELLIKLSVFARAGHRDRVREALGEVARIYPSAEDQGQIFRVVKNAVVRDDLAALRIYYERFAAGTDDRTDGFIELWNAEGDPRELESWLQARARANEFWWSYWIDFKKKRGTLKEVTNELARQIRANPSDYALVRKYLRVVMSNASAQVVEISPIKSNIGWFEEDVSWLADVVKTDSAYTAFDLGIMLKEVYPDVAIGLLEKSLALGVTEEDLKSVNERIFQGAQIFVPVKNPEKQLRVWTKAALVDIYRKTNRAILAQPLVEELTATDMSDVRSVDAFYNAGAVQASTGARVVESRILQAEAANENSPAYWESRMSYYHGRGEDELVWQTYTRALERFPYQPNDVEAALPRLRILQAGRAFDDDNPAAVEILRSDFVKALAKKDYQYLFFLLRTIHDDYEPLHNEFFVNSDLLPKVLATRAEWNYDEGFAIGDVMDQEKWDAGKRDAVWDQLIAVAGRNNPKRLYRLAETMIENGAGRKAVPLLLECLKIAPVEDSGALPFNRRDIETDLFDIYLGANDWKAAEKIWRDGEINTVIAPGRIAVAAAGNGRIADAVRLWKLNANRDRRNLEQLAELAKTPAKKPLREYYERMKTADPLSDAPAKALVVLQ